MLIYTLACFFFVLFLSEHVLTNLSVDIEFKNAVSFATASMFNNATVSNSSLRRYIFQC